MHAPELPLKKTPARARKRTAQSKSRVPAPPPSDAGQPSATA